MPRGLALNGKKRLYRTTDWAWKGFAGIKNTMRNSPLTPQPNPQPNLQTTPQSMKPRQIRIKRHLFPSSWSKKHLKPRCLAIVRLRPTESTALAVKESHLFPTWRANPQKTSETTVFGNSAASTYWKHSFCNEREPPLPNMMSQPTKNLWNHCVWQ